MTQDEIPVHESTRKRRRWGCTCGCLALAVVLLFALVGLTAWLVRPVRPHAYPNWVDASIDGFGLLSLDKDDEGMNALTAFVLKRLGTRLERQVPPSERKAVAASASIARKTFDRFVHPEVVFLLQSGATGEEEALAAVQLRNRLAVLLAGTTLNERLPNASSAATTDTALALYLLRQAANGRSPAYVALTHRTLLLSDSTEMISRAAERSVSPEAGEPSQELLPYMNALALDQPTPGRDLAFAAVTPPGRLMGWIAALEEVLHAEGLTENLESALKARKVSLDDVEGLTVSGDVTSADKVTFTITLYGSRMDTARRLAEALRLSLNQIMARVEGAAATGGLETRVDVKPLGTSVVASLNVSGLQKLIERWIPLPPAQ